MKTTIHDCRLVQLPVIKNRAGNITPVVNDGETVPFQVKRVFYMYDVPGGASRGAHAHKKCEEFLVAASGAFDVQINDGSNKQIVQLNRPYLGLYIPSGIWASEMNFSSGAICLVLASEKYIEEDYIRNYKEFLTFI